MYDVRSYCEQGVAQAKETGTFVMRRVKGFHPIDWLVMQLTAFVTGLLCGVVLRRTAKKLGFFLALASGVGIAYLVVRIFFFDNPVKRIREYIRY
ncbi:MAG: hypothetical protein E7409_05445 [Ruminococcaceae bacterium]|nr:hypothetical protein [Oscillospiraceae bacterium]